jgi:hypothetical protein
MALWQRTTFSVSFPLTWRHFLTATCNHRGERERGFRAFDGRTDGNASGRMSRDSLSVASHGSRPPDSVSLALCVLPLISLLPPSAAAPIALKSVFIRAAMSRCIERPESVRRHQR